MTSAALAVTSPPAPARAAARTERVTTPQVIAVTLLCIAHIGLAAAMRQMPVLATVHGAVVLVVGAGIALGSRRPQRAALVVGYIAGSEVLWRMCRASLFWEYGKYASIAVMMLAVLRCAQRRTVKLAAVYFGLLLPSAFITIDALGLSLGREEISFVLSGPLCIGVAVVFFSSLTFTLSDLRATFVAVVAPVVGIATIAFLSTRAAGNIVFVDAGNQLTSGGFGPNQVSAMLGLGVMLLLLIAMDGRIPWRLRVPAVLVAAALGTQSALTFSRGGLAMAFAGAAGALLYLVRANARARIAVAVVSISAALLGKYVIEPRLEAETGGKLAERYSNYSSTGRDEFALGELEMFLDRPALGVGPGVGMFVRQETGGVQGASHTEYSRMLGEHGVLGLLSLGCLVLLLAGPLRSRADLTARSMATAFVIWTALFLLVNATRLAAPGIVLGLGYAAARMRPARVPP